MGVFFCVFGFIEIKKGFGGNINHDSHITSTHYAILVLGQWNCLNRIDVEAAADYVRKLQQEDVSFIDQNFEFSEKFCRGVLWVMCMAKSTQDLVTADRLVLKYWINRIT